MAKGTDTSSSSSSAAPAQDVKGSSPPSAPGLPGSDERADGMPPRVPQPQIPRAAAEAAAGGRGNRSQEVGGGTLFVSDARFVLLLLDEARYRAVHRLFGVSREHSWPVTLVGLALVAQAAKPKWDAMMRGPGGPTRADVGLGAAAVRELLTGISGPTSRETPLFGTLVTIAVLGGVVRPGVKRTVQGITRSSHRVRHSFNHRYGHLLPTFSTDRERRGARSG